MLCKLLQCLEEEEILPNSLSGICRGQKPTTIAQQRKTTGQLHLCVKKKKINAKLQNKILANKIHRSTEREKVTRNK